MAAFIEKIRSGISLGRTGINIQRWTYSRWQPTNHYAGSGALLNSIHLYRISNTTGQPYVSYRYIDVRYSWSPLLMTTCSSQNNGHIFNQVRWMSAKRKGFLGEFVEGIRNDMKKNKEMKESLKKFREEAQKLEQSESLQKAREKYQAIESETLRGSDTLKKKLNVIQDKLKEVNNHLTLDEVEKSDYAKKGKEWVDEIGRTYEKTAESVSKQGEQIAQSHIYKTVSHGVQAVKEEIEDSRGKLYKPPKKLRKRETQSTKAGDDQFVQPNADASGVVLHKDSQWSQSWQAFKDNNQIVNKLFDMKTKFDESDNALIRATRTVTDKLSELFGGVFTKTEMSEVLTEIVKMDPSFDKEQFIKQCQFDMIPNILEAMVRGDLEILQDWCYEGAFNVLATPMRQAQAAMYKMDSQVLDISHVDLVAGKMMDQGPVLVLSFNAQQIMVVRDSKGKVIEGDPEKIMRVFHVWAFCRDQQILNPRAAWRLIDLSSSPVEQWL